MVVDPSLPRIFRRSHLRNDCLQRNRLPNYLSPALDRGTIERRKNIGTTP
jgi:hypothetical protein